MCLREESGGILRILGGRFWVNFGRVERGRGILERVERVDTCRAWRIEWWK